MNRKSLKKKIVSDSIVITFCSFLKRFRGLIFLPVIISQIGISQYGAFMQILINSQLISPFCTMALGMGLLRFTSQYQNSNIEELSRDYWTVMWAGFVLALLGSAAIYLTAPLVSRHILDDQFLAPLRCSCLLVISNVLWTQNNKYLKSRKQFKYFAFFDFCYQMFPYLSFVLTIILTKNLPYGIIVYISVELLIAASIQLAIARNLLFVRPCFHIFKKFIAYSWALILNEVSSGILSKIDRYFIGYYLNNIDIGLYNIAYSIASLIANISIPFNNYLLAYMPKLWDKGLIQKVTQITKDCLFYYLIVSVGLIVILSSYSEPLLSFLLKKDIYQFTDNFHEIILIIGSGILCYGCNNIHNVIIRCRQKNHYSMIFQLFAAMLNCLLNILLIKKLGIAGAGIATFISYFSVFLLSNYFFSIHITRINLYRFASICVAGAILAGILMLMTPVNLFQLTCYVIVGMTAYSIIILLSRAVTLTEIKSIFI